MNAAHDILPDVEGCDNEEEEDACIVSQTQTARTLLLKDLPIQEEVIERVEISSGTDTEPKVLKLICPYCQQTFETYDKIEKHIEIHIMR